MLLQPVRLLAFLLLPGCATIVQGAGQNLTVTTNPAGASCRLERQGAAVGVIAPTPGTLRLDKSRQELVVTCSREGHDPTTARHVSEFGPATFGNFIVGGLIASTLVTLFVLPALYLVFAAGAQRQSDIGLAHA